MNGSLELGEGLPGGSRSAPRGRHIPGSLRLSRPARYARLMNLLLVTRAAEGWDRRAFTEVLAMQDAGILDDEAGFAAA